jgi:hypothetical protein
MCKKVVYKLKSGIIFNPEKKTFFQRIEKPPKMSLYYFWWFFLTAKNKLVLVLAAFAKRRQ